MVRSNKDVSFRPAGMSTTPDLLGFSGKNISTISRGQFVKETHSNLLNKMACWGQRRTGKTDSRRQWGGSASNNRLLQLRYAEKHLWMANMLDLKAAEDHTGCHSSQLCVEHCGYN